MEIVLVLLAFIAGATIVLLLVDGVSDFAARAVVGAFNWLRGGDRSPSDSDR